MGARPTVDASGSASRQVHHIEQKHPSADAAQSRIRLIRRWFVKAGGVLSFKEDCSVPDHSSRVTLDV